MPGLGDGVPAADGEHRSGRPGLVPAVEVTELTSPRLAAVTLRIDLRARVPVSVTVFCSVRACTLLKMATSP